MNDRMYVLCKGNKAYSPIGVSNLFRQAEKENNGDLEVVFKNKKRYKDLIEMYHGSFLALVLYKNFGEKFKFNICSAKEDPPDLYFIQENGNGAFPVEIMELYNHKGGFKTYKELAEHIWNKKGKKKYDKCYLLLASRLSAKNFNLTKFIQEFKKFKWDFERIYLSLYAAKKQEWTFFEIFFPPNQYNISNHMYFNLKKDKQLWY